MDFTNAGQRAFDITCGNQTLARNLDIFTAAGGAGRVLLLTNQIDFAGDAALGRSRSSSPGARTRPS